jgi:superfamily II DNA/RNA helicase
MTWQSQLLSSRVVTRLRALVVLPTRDLVTQVRETFETIGKGRGLKVCVRARDEMQMALLMHIVWF